MEPLAAQRDGISDSAKAAAKRHSDGGVAGAACPRAGGVWAQLWAGGLVGLTTAVGFGLDDRLSAPDLVMLYLAAIGLTAFAFGRAPSLVSATLSVLAYDFFFVDPRYTFAVTDQRNLLTFAMMFALGLLLSGLTLKLREETRLAELREETRLAELRASQTAALHALSRDLGGARDETQAARIGARHAAQLLGTPAAVFLVAPGVGPVCEPSSPDFVLSPHDLSAAAWAAQHSRTAGAGTPGVPLAAVFCLPLRTGVGSRPLGRWR